MILLYPVWLFLAVPLLVSLWLWPLPTRLLRGLRLAALVLLLLGLCGATLRLPSRAGTVVVVADRSASMPSDSEGIQKEAIRLLQEQMGPDDRLSVVSFGRTSAIERVPRVGSFGGFLHEVGSDASNLDEALQTALTQIPKDSPGRILVLSDGRWTGRDPIAAGTRAASRGVAIDYRHLEQIRAGDLAIQRIDAPATVSPGEAFLVTAWVLAPAGQEASYVLRRGGVKISEGRHRLEAGLNRLTFRDRAVNPGNQEYTLEVEGSNSDPVADNNRARLLVGVGGPRPLLHVSRSADSGLARLLRAGKLDLEVRAPELSRWDLAALGRYSAVLLENVPAEKIGTGGMETLAAWVRGTGSGLMMTGGRESYGPGGYYRSPLEPVLPVSMELRNEHRKLALAIVVVLDRSGSMSMPVGGGRVKMDLANQGAAQVLDMLGPMDEFGCLAVDTVAHTIAALGPAGGKAGVRSKLLSIQSMGGGIFVYVALSEAARMLTKAKAATRHIILFSDAADSEEPGKYQDLVKKCSEAGITVSVIGLGKKTDKDGALLKDIAKLGKGQCFFTDRAEDLPRLFAQDTLVVARSTFLDEPTPVKAGPALQTLTGRAFDLTRPLGGYNLCYLRPDAAQGVVTLDEYRAPVVASWQAGTGRVVCYTGEADGKYAGEMAHWKHVGDFYTSLARWAAGPSGPLPDNMMTTQEVRKGINYVRLHLDPERKRDLVSTPPRVVTLHGRGGGTVREVSGEMHWAGPDTLEVEIPLRGEETSLTTVEVPGHGAVSLPPVCLPYSPEFQPAGGDSGLAILERLGRATGGRERIDLKGTWEELPRYPRMVEVGKWLLLAAAVVFLLEVLERRTGLLSRPRGLSRDTGAEGATVSRRWFSWWKRSRPKADVLVAVSPEPGPAPVEAPAAAVTPARPVEEPASGGMIDALRKARKRSRRRAD
jgi:von Willebrand factor type A domain